VQPAARPGRKEAAVLRRDRAQQRQLKHGSAAAADQSGLTFLQRFKVKPVTRSGFDIHVTEFLKWCRLDSLSAVAGPQLDRLLAEYFDHLFWKGEKSEAGSRLLAAVQHHLPSLPRARFGGLPEARAALGGFRTFSRSQPMGILVEQYMLGLVGVSALEGDYEYAGAIFLAWDSMLRLPSDLLSLRGNSIVGPGRKPKAQWALLLYREEHGTRSKTYGVDEGVMLRYPTWTGAGQRFLERLRTGCGPDQSLWSFSEDAFKEKFRRRLAMLPGAPLAIPYQLRHGAASHAAAVEGWSQERLMAQLRHASAQSTARYARHVRYLAEMEKVPRELQAWSDVVRNHLDQILGDQLPPPRPSFLSHAVATSCGPSRRSAVSAAGGAASSSSKSASGSGRSLKRSTLATGLAPTGLTGPSLRRRRCDGG